MRDGVVPKQAETLLSCTKISDLHIEQKFSDSCSRTKKLVEYTDNKMM
jgi:hypothetical protein